MPRAMAFNLAYMVYDAQQIQFPTAASLPGSYAPGPATARSRLQGRPIQLRIPDIIHGAPAHAMCGGDSGF